MATLPARSRRFAGSTGTKRSDGRAIGAKPECQHGHSRRGECMTCGLNLPFEDRKGGDPSEWPEDLRVREFPKGHAR